MENDLESRLETILSDPDMMQKLQAMAQTLGQSPSGNPPSAPAGLEPGMLQKLGSLAGQSCIDKNQQALLSAISPYLSSMKVQKLEKAMRAAKMARMASGFLNSGGLQLLTGR